jgi:hypothetical protein
VKARRKDFFAAGRVDEHGGVTMEGFREVINSIIVADSNSFRIAILVIGGLVFLLIGYGFWVQSSQSTFDKRRGSRETPLS